MNWLASWFLCTCTNSSTVATNTSTDNLTDAPINNLTNMATAMENLPSPFPAALRRTEHLPEESKDSDDEAWFRTPLSPPSSTTSTRVTRKNPTQDLVNLAHPVRKFTCDNCNRSFNDEHNLSRHFFCMTKDELWSYAERINDDK